MICPFQKWWGNGEDICAGFPCQENSCPLWCDGEKECSIKVLALEAIKREEK